MTITMVFGSFIAGATSEGGGAVAFPVMTLVFQIEPVVARDFSLLIQSAGMTFAASFILLEGITIEKRAILFSGMGGILGVILGVDVLSQLIPASYLKTLFVALWLSFGIWLIRINKNPNRFVRDGIENFDLGSALAFCLVGFAGGVVVGPDGEWSRYHDVLSAGSGLQSQ